VLISVTDVCEWGEVLTFVEGETDEVNLIGIGAMIAELAVLVAVDGVAIMYLVGIGLEGEDSLLDSVRG